MKPSYLHSYNRKITDSEKIQSPWYKTYICSLNWLIGFTSIIILLLASLSTWASTQISGFTYQHFFNHINKKEGKSSENQKKRRKINIFLIVLTNTQTSLIITSIKVYLKHKGFNIYFVNTIRSYEIWEMLKNLIQYIKVHVFRVPLKAFVDF